MKTVPVTAGLALTLAACTTAPTSAPTTAPPAVPAPTAALSPSPTVTAHGCTAWQARPNSVDTIDYARTVLHSTALVTVSSVLVGFYQGGLQVGSEQMNPRGQGTAGTQMVLAPGPASVTLISDDIYVLYGVFALTWVDSSSSCAQPDRYNIGSGSGLFVPN